jgi:MFS family permease
LTSAQIPSSNRRWTIALLLGIGVLVNYFDRVNLSISHDALLATFGLSTVTFGYLLSAYSWTYALMQVPSGILLDRFGVRRVMLCSVLLWAAASAGAALARSIPLFFLARLLLGIGEAPTFPANAKAIGEWFPPEERSTPTAIFDASAKLAVAIGIPVLGAALFHFGWRSTFLMTSAASFVFALLFALIYTDPELIPAQAASAPTSATGQPTLVYLIRQRKVWGLTIGSAAYNYSFYLLLTWLPFYLASAFHVNLLRSVSYSAIPWLFAAITDFLIGGLMVNWLIHRGFSPDVVRRTVLIGGTILGLFIFGVAIAASAKVAIICLTIALAGLAASAPVGWSVPSLIAPPGATGRVGAVSNFGSQISAITAPIITGYIVAYRHSFSAAFIVAGIFLIIGIFGYAFLLGRIETIPAPTAE